MTDHLLTAELDPEHVYDVHNANCECGVYERPASLDIAIANRTMEEAVIGSLIEMTGRNHPHDQTGVACGSCQAYELLVSLQWEAELTAEHLRRTRIE